MAAFTSVTCVREAPMGPFNGKIFKMTSGGGPGAADLGLNVKLLGATNCGGSGSEAATGNVGNWVLNSSNGTEDSSNGQIYCVNACDSGTFCYVWVIF